MVAALEIDLGLIREAVIDDGRHAVGDADRGHGAELTVGERPADLVFRGETQGASGESLDCIEKEVVRGWQHRQ